MHVKWKQPQSCQSSDVNRPRCNVDARPLRPPRTESIAIKCSIYSNYILSSVTVIKADPLSQTQSINILIYSPSTTLPGRFSLTLLKVQKDQRAPKLHFNTNILFGLCRRFDYEPSVISIIM